MPKGLAAQVEKKATVTTAGGQGKQQGEGGGSGSGDGENPAPKVKGRISLRKAGVLIKMARLSQKNRTSEELKKEIVRLKDLANQLTEEEEMMLAEAAAKVERKAKESRVRRLSMMLSDIENQNRDLLGGSQLNLVKAQKEAQVAEELKLKQGAQEQAQKELQEAMAELDMLEAGAGDVGVQGAAGEGEGEGAVEEGGKDDEEEEEEIDINVADPGAEAMLEELLSDEMLRIFDASPEVSLITFPYQYQHYQQHPLHHHNHNNHHHNNNNNNNNNNIIPIETPPVQLDHNIHSTRTFFACTAFGNHNLDYVAANLIG